MKTKSIKHRLLNCRYYYPHGLFDLVRKKGGELPHAFVPEHLRTLASGEVSHDSLLLVNRDYPVTADRQGLVAADEEGLAPLGRGFLLDPIAKEPFRRLFEACLAECGEALLFTSTYRTLAEQAELEKTNDFAVPAGESEHHLGLSADVKVEGFGGRRFLLTKAGRWVAENGHRFGFIIRYPFWAEKRTGIDYEPWHLRYVGACHAEILYRRKLTLEEYLALFELGGFYRFGKTVISRQSGPRFVFPPECETVFVSRDVRGGYILWGEVE